MQRSVKEAFGRSTKRQERAEEPWHPRVKRHCSTDRNSKDGKPSLFSVLNTQENLGVNTSKALKSKDPVCASTNPFAKMTTGPVIGRSGPAHIRRPVPSPATRTQENAAPAHPHQKAHHASVRNFQTATRLDKTFAGAAAGAAERADAAQAAWNATKRTRRAATSRMHKETTRAESVRQEILDAHKEKIEADRRMREQQRHYAEVSRKAAQDYVRGLRRGAYEQVPYERRPKAQEAPYYQGEDWATFFANGGTYAEKQQEWARAEVQRDREAYFRDINNKDPDDCWGMGTESSRRRRSRPDDSYADYYGSGSPGYGGPAYASDYGSGYSGECSEQQYDSYYDQNTEEGEEEVEESEEQSDEEGDSDQEYGGGGFTREQWEEWKRSWGQHSCGHHNDWYYTHDTGGAGGSSRHGHIPTQGASYNPVSKEAAVEAGSRALQAAQRPVASEGEEAALESEIEKHVADAARWSGNNIVVFAAALGVAVEDSGGVENAERLARRQLLLVFHPDKLQAAGGRGLLLGERVTQALNDMSARA